MSLNARICSSNNKNIIMVLRKFNSDAKPTHEVSSSRLYEYLSKMSVNQWKLITQLKEQFSDKSIIMHIVRRDWIDLLKKVPAFSNQITTQEVTTKPYADSKMSTVLLESVQILNDFKAKFSQNPPIPPKPMNDSRFKKIKTVSAESIISRTNYLISSLASAKTEDSTLKRLQDFMNHILEYPDASGIAVKNGAVRVLLRIRRDSKKVEISESVQEALAMVGFVDPPTERGIRILSIDGGGVRGLLVIEMLKRLEQLTNKKVFEMFDFICGVSTGSILACALGGTGKSLEEVENLYKVLSTKIFTQSTFEGARSLLWNHGYYDTALWENMLKENIGNYSFQETARKRFSPKLAAVSTVVSQGQVVPFVFRNYELPYRVRSQYIGSNRYKLWEAARASAAAPAYFGEFRLDNFLHQDGGMIVNNPTAVALHEAKLLWPKKSIQCIVSCGTGRVNPTLALHRDESDLSKQSSWKEKFTQILVSATDTEAVHTVLSDLLPNTRYYRFNPYLTEMLSMVEYQPEKLSLLEQDAAMYIRRNDEKFAEAAEILSEKKPLIDQCKDWISLQAATYQPFY